MIAWPWLLLPLWVGFASAVWFAREELAAREERINRLRAIVREQEIELAQLQAAASKAKFLEALEHESLADDEFVDRSDPDWWKKA
jgi:hypothetical protein